MNAKKDWIFFLVIVLAAYGFVTEIRNNPAGVLTMIILAGIVLFLIRMFLTGSYPGKGVRSGYRRNAPFRSGTTFHKTKTRPKRKTNLRVIEGKKKPDENNKKYYH